MYFFRVGMNDAISSLWRALAASCGAGICANDGTARLRQSGRTLLGGKRARGSLAAACDIIDAPAKISQQL